MKTYLRISHRILQAFQGAASVCMVLVGLFSVCATIDGMAEQNLKEVIIAFLAAILVRRILSGLKAFGDVAWQIAHYEWEIDSAVENDSLRESAELLERTSNKKVNLFWKVVGGIFPSLYLYCNGIEIGWEFTVDIGLTLLTWATISASLLYCAGRTYSARGSESETIDQRFKQIRDREQLHSEQPRP